MKKDPEAILASLGCYGAGMHHHEKRYPSPDFYQISDLIKKSRILDFANSAKPNGKIGTNKIPL